MCDLMWYKRDTFVLLKMCNDQQQLFNCHGNEIMSRVSPLWYCNGMLAHLINVCFTMTLRQWKIQLINKSINAHHRWSFAKVSSKQSSLHTRWKVKTLLQHVCLNAFWVLVRTWFVGWKLSKSLGVPTNLTAHNSVFHVSRTLWGNLISQFVSLLFDFFCFILHFRFCCCSYS